MHNGVWVSFFIWSRSQVTLTENERDLLAATLKIGFFVKFLLAEDSLQKSWSWPFRAYSRQKVTFNFGGERDRDRLIFLLFLLWSR